MALQHTQLTARTEGTKLWTAKARSYRGTLDRSRLEEVFMVREPQSPGEKTYHVSAPTAHISEQGRRADFVDFSVEDREGGTLRGPRGTYSEAETRITAEGGLSFQTQTLDVRAPSGVLHLNSGELELEGPVVGRWASTPTPPTALPLESKPLPPDPLPPE